MQCGQRRAARGMSIAHCGHGRVVGAAAAGAGACIRFACLTMRKTTKPTITKLMTLLMNILREADGSVRVVHETHRTGLFGRDVWIAALADAGFVPEMIIEETTEDRTPRDVFVGRLPRA